MAFDFMRRSQIGLVDVAVQGGINWFATGKAAQSEDMRWTWGQPGQPSSPWRDYRFAGGLVGLGLHTFAGGDIGRAGLDAGAGLLHSFVATERMRKAAIERVAAGAGGTAQIPGQAPAPLPGGAPPVQPGAAAPAGAFDNFRSFLPGGFR